jgi:signal transduction histidine kinase
MIRLGYETVHLGIKIVKICRSSSSITKPLSVSVTFIQQNGAEAAHKEITGKTGKFNNRDLYVVVYQLDGKVLAHGANAKLVGKDMKDAQDVDGKYFVKERIELASKQASFWQDYKFVNPETRKIEPKQMYCERVAETAVCAGVYKN